MKEMKPKFILTRVYDDGSQDVPEITALSQAIDEAQMNRRGFFGAGLAASAALVFLDSCATAWNTRSTSRPVDKECGKTYAHSDDVTRLAVSGSSAILASGSEDSTVKCWNLSNLALVQTFKSNSSPRIALNLDGTVIAFSISSSSNELRSLPSGKLLKTFEGQCFRFSPDGKRLIVGNSGLVDIHNPADGTVRSTSVSAGNPIESLAVSPDGNYIAVGVENKGVLLLDNDGKEIKTLASGYSTKELVFNPDGQSLAVIQKASRSSNSEATIIFSVPDGKKLYEVDKRLGGLDFSSNGKWLFWSQPEITALHTHSFELRTLAPLKNELSMIPVPDGQSIITGGRDGSVKIWLWPNVEFSKCLMDVDCSGKKSRGTTFNYTDEWGQMLSYTLPCGSPLPAGATCTCNCVPGKMESVCTCDRVCTCNKVCSCLSVGGYRYCTCNRVCVCLAV
jgi:WD40 repeat protein